MIAPNSAKHELLHGHFSAGLHGFQKHKIIINKAVEHERRKELLGHLQHRTVEEV